MKEKISLLQRLQLHSNEYHQVVEFNKEQDKIVSIDLTNNNEALKKIDLTNTQQFSEFINEYLQNHKAKFAVGGYDENRTVYQRSDLFSGQEARTIHLGIDIWGTVNTTIHAPFGGMVHSFAFNDNFGDYGATIILLHQLDGNPFYTLYGHLSLKDIKNLKEGSYINRGEIIGHFGPPAENGYWPPHLHFQIIEDLENYKGDYPGVCTIRERTKFLKNCPDPDVILNMLKYASDK